MKKATRSFVAVIDGERIAIDEGENVHDSHDVVRQYPDCFRAFPVSEELAIRSARIAEINDMTRVTNYEPESAAGRRERDELRFWDQVDRMVNRDDRSPEERAEQAWFDRATARLEESDARELAEVNAEAVRDYGFDREGWSRRIAG